MEGQLYLSGGGAVPVGWLLLVLLLVHEGWPYLAGVKEQLVQLYPARGISGVHGCWEG